MPERCVAGFVLFATPSDTAKATEGTRKWLSVIWNAGSAPSRAIFWRVLGWILSKAAASLLSSICCIFKPSPPRYSNPQANLGIRELILLHEVADQTASSEYDRLLADIALGVSYRRGRLGGIPAECLYELSLQIVLIPLRSVL